MKEQIVELTKQLIAIKTDPANLAELKRALGLVSSYFDGFTIERFSNGGSESILIYPHSKRPEKFRLIINCHLDVIPGKQSQYKPYIKEGKLYGVGAMDMKGGLATSVLAFKQLAKQSRYPIALQIVTDEETGGFNGTKHQLDQGVRADFVITSEPTNLNIVNQAKGIIWMKISATGKTAHGAYPWRGENAIWLMHDFLKDLRLSFPIPEDEAWKTTVNLSTINTKNAAYNKIPDDCEIGLDIRFIPEDKDIVVPTIQRILPESFELELIASEDSLYVSPDNVDILNIKSAVKSVLGNLPVLYGAQGSSDARHYTKLGIPGVEFGPIGGGIGSDDEWVDIDSLENYSRILSKIILSLK